MIDSQNGIQEFDLRGISELTAKAPRKELGQEEFLKLMTAQLQNQDPTKPMESGEFLSQISQFSTVEGIGDLNAKFEALSQSLVSNQALQATNLVGRKVLAPTGLAVLNEAGGLNGSAELPAASGDVAVSIYDQAGQLVRRLELGSQSAGPVSFQWDGLKDDGQYAVPGTYFVTAEAGVNGNTEAVETLLASEVRSVTLSNSGGLLLDLNGIGSVDFSEVRQIL